MPPDFSSSPQPVTVRRFSLDEREEIACRRAAGEGVRAIAVALGRSPSTISRELRRGTVRRKSGYRATVAQALADQRSRRPKARVLERNDRLREHVQNRLHAKDSPEQISCRLLIDYPDDQTMRISHETIYRCLYVQGRGGLRRELVTCLRTGRALRKTRRTTGRRGRITGMVNIAERPAEAADRAVPGHWEGDLITGAENKSAIGTLVERATGYVTLLHLPNGHGAEAVQEAMSHPPATLRRTLAWDQGERDGKPRRHRERHRACDLLLRPPLAVAASNQREHERPAASVLSEEHDLSGYRRDYFDFVAAQLNNRPRKRLGWRTPAEALDQLLSESENPPGVALTG